jgi:hypothetical protein
MHDADKRMNPAGCAAGLETACDLTILFHRKRMHPEILGDDAIWDNGTELEEQNSLVHASDVGIGGHTRKLSNECGRRRLSTSKSSADTVQTSNVR